MTVSTWLKYIPNLLTFFRLFLIVPFLLFLSRAEYFNALYLYLAAGFTDILDGWLARHYHWQSNLGSFIDPLADKLLIASSFISLGFIGSLPWWLVILVFLRDLTISMGVLAWYAFVKQTLDFQPTFLSKVNTTVQLTLVTLCLFELAFSNFIPPAIRIACMGITAFTTAITYVDYVWTWGKKAWIISH